MASEEPQKYLSVLGQESHVGTRVNLQWSGSRGEDSSGKQKGNAVIREHNLKVDQEIFKLSFSF